MRHSFLLFGLLAGCAPLSDDPAYLPAAEPPEVPGESWVKVRTPEDVGFSSAGLGAALETARAIGSDAVMVLSRGRLVAAWGDTSGRWYVASVRKSLLSILYGAPLASGVIPLLGTLAQLGIDDRDPPLSLAEKQATVRDLLTSSSGVYHRAAASDVETLPARESTRPGEVFFYNNWDFNALGTIYGERTGVSLFADFDARVARPLGLQDFVAARDGRFELEPVSVHPAYHFDMTARDMARVGLMVARGGRWIGEERVVGTDWLTVSTTTQIVAPPSEGSMGYGYMWWVVTDGSALAELGIPVGTFFANGNLNQFIMIVPSRDVVIVHRGPSGDVSWTDKARLVTAILAAQR